MTPEATGAPEPPVPEADLSRDGFDEVLQEIRKVESAAGSWGENASFLIISLVLFAAAGGLTDGFGVNPVRQLAILIPVLLIHECGHWAAMKAFGYRNVKMFFIPFFGAAVSGRQVSIEGWQKAIVSLSGPLPGIAIGATIGALGIIRQSPTLLQLATTFLTLNGINLLPMLPLDGGWVIQTIFASRLVWLEMLFRIGATVGFIAFGAWSGDKVLYFLAYLMAVSIPAAYRSARVARELRVEGISPAEGDASIPEAAARRIHERLGGGFSGPKPRARAILDIFEAVHIQPPGWAVSVLFALTQAGALFATLLFLGLLSRGGSRTAVARPTAEPSPLPYVVEASQMKMGPRDPSSSIAQRAHSVLIADFGSHEGASGQVDLFKREKTLQAAAIGPHLFLVFDDDAAARKRWFEAVERLHAAPFISTIDLPAQVEFACRAQDAAAGETLAAEIQESLYDEDVDLPPSWSESMRAEPARASLELARKTRARIKEIIKSVTQAATEESAAAIEKQIRAGESASAERLREELRRKIAETVRAEVQKLHGSADLAQTVLDRFLARDWMPPAPEGSRLMTTAAFPPDADLSAARGFAFAADRRLLVFVHAFRSYMDGLPGVLRWLDAKGCRGLSYDLKPFSSEGDSQS
ncbi:MAG: site-2 protease family protein [Vicinamibacteria bacterium]|nr:site-2 protease family protein [Vicinamibacteria bacterium]